MATTKEKDELISTLKEKIRNLENLVKPDEDFNPKNIGMSIIKENGFFYLVELEIDMKSGKAMVSKSKEIGKDYLLAAQKGKKHLLEVLIPFKTFYK